MTGQRLVVQNSSVRSAYCPPPALVAAASAAMPGWLTAVDRGGEQAVDVIEVAGQADRHHRVRIRDRPEHQHLGTGAAQLLHEAGQAVDPRRVVGRETRQPTVLPVPYPRHMLTTTSRGCSARNRARI